MDPRELVSDPMEGMRTALDGRQSKMWTAIPGIIQSFDATKQTAVVQPAVQVRVSQPDPSTGATTTSYKNLPQCMDVPVHFPQGGDAIFTFPVKEGDECVLKFCSRSIDNWWQSGGVQPPAEARMHDLSDAVAYVGFNSTPNVPSDISTSAAQLRSRDASTTVSLDPTAQTVEITAPGGVTITADVTIQGNLTVTGLIISETDVQVGDITLTTHLHDGVTTGSGDTGAPVAP